MSAALRAQEIAEQAERHFAAGRKGLFMPSSPLRNHDAAIPDGNAGFEYASLEDAFPDVNPLIKPTGNLVLVQMRQPPLANPDYTLFYGPETIQTEKDNNQIAKVIAIGPLAFHNRDTGQPWPEGAWCKVGDFIRVPKYQGDMWTVPYRRVAYERDERTGDLREKVGRDYVRFALFKDLAITGTTDDPLAVRAFY